MRPRRTRPRGTLGCVVEALAIYEGWARERFTGSRMCDPLFAISDDRLVTRADVQRAAMQAAVAEGVDPNDLGSHREAPHARNRRMRDPEGEKLRM